MGDSRPSMDAPMRTFGVPAIVTVPNGTPVPTSVIWLAPVMVDEPSGSDFTRREPRRVLALSRTDVPTLPRQTQIDAAEIKGGPVSSWLVDQADVARADEWRALVVSKES